MSFSRLKVETVGPVARVTLNRPEVRNAFDAETIQELRRAFGEIGADDAVRAVILAGAGKAFCAGADIGWMRSSVDFGEEENRRDAMELAEMLRTLDECPKPLIGRIHGAVMGGAIGLVAVCDVAVASEETKFAFSEVRLGIIPSVISCFVVPKIGAARARRYFATAELFRAPEAKEMGLVHEVAPPDRIDACIDGILKSVLLNGPKAVAETKILIRTVLASGREEGLRYAAESIARLRTSPEGQEGLRAFLEKRPPNWAKS